MRQLPHPTHHVRVTVRCLSFKVGDARADAIARKDNDAAHEQAIDDRYQIGVDDTVLTCGFPRVPEGLWTEHRSDANSIGLAAHLFGLAAVADAPLVIAEHVED